MWKNHKRTIILTTILCLLPIVAGLIFWDQLPEQMAIHFNAANEPDNWASKPVAVLGMPAFLAALHVLCLFVTVHDPKNRDMTGVMKTMTFWICPFISWLCAALTMGHALGAVSNIGMAVCVFLGILFMVIGNYLPKCTPNYTIGIKLPWTLNDEGNWRYTHRIGGFCFVVAGLLTLATAFFGTVWLSLAALLLAAVIPTVASFLYYKKRS